MLLDGGDLPQSEPCEAELQHGFLELNWRNCLHHCQLHNKQGPLNPINSNYCADVQLH